MQPYLITQIQLVEWRIGSLSIAMPRYALGNTLSWQPNQILRQDLALHRNGRHRHTGFHFIFDGWSRSGVKPRQRAFRITQTAFRDYPGAVSQLIFPLTGERRRIIVGIAHDPIFEEVNNCLAKLEFDFDMWEDRT